MEENLYWIIEYGKVFLGYGILMFLWPMVMFRKFLSGKSVTFRFFFCVTGQVVLINTVVLLLGLLHILNEWTMRILFYGSFLYSIRGYLALTKERKTKLKYLVNGSYGWKNFLMVHRRKLIRRIEAGCERLGRFYKKQWLEYSLLIVALVYAMIYFSWGVFHEHSYGFSDIIVHHNWIYELAQGNPFSAGIYPEGMHCVVYALYSLFGIRIYNCLLFISFANLVVMLLALYCFLKELFRWRFSAIIVLAVVLTFGEVGHFITLCTSRLQCALPQEYAFPAVFICALYLVRYLKGNKKGIWKGTETKICWNEDLLIFMLAFVSTIVIHFYATIMAFFICIAIVAVFWKRVFSKEHFLPLVVAVVAGVVIAVTPMAAGYLTGIPLQGSLYWAVGVMQGTEEEPQEDIVNEEVEIPKEEYSEQIMTPEKPSLPEQEQMPDYEETKHTILEKIVQKVKETGIQMWEKICSISVKLYENSYLQLYGENVARAIILITGAIVFFGILITIIWWNLRLFAKKKVIKPEYKGYFVILYVSLLYMFVYAATSLNLPVLIGRTRVCFILHVITIALLVLPLDFLFGMGKRIMPVWLLQMFSLGAVIGSVASIIVAGKYHGYLYFELSRYDVSVQLTNEIIDELPEGKYTIVSPTDELYQVAEYGRHEEVIEFIDMQKKTFYFLPTEYVFIFLEKRPLQQVQLLFFDGPAWLADKKISTNFAEKSVWPDYITSEISEEAAQEELPHYSKKSNYYLYLDSKTIIESKVYEWCKKFEELYPNEMRVYYEDENFICYYFRQNEQSLYNLNLE